MRGPGTWNLFKCLIKSQLWWTYAWWTLSSSMLCMTISKEALEILHIDEYLMLDNFYITKYLREKLYNLVYLPFRILLWINIILQEYDIAFTVIYFHLMITKNHIDTVWKSCYFIFTFRINSKFNLSINTFFSVHPIIQ